MISRFDVAFQEYSDAYKEYHGVRPLFWNASSIEEMEEWTNRYYDWIAEDLAQERADEDASINACMEAGAPDIDTAMRWLEQANVHTQWA
tara:strand:- start:214 stop:483 length:270 start_codon:yes stop_codon:yes gene_type:complete